MREFWRDAEPVRERVHVLGELSRDAALPIVARAAVVVLPSLWENLANAALEALALGRPLVATNAGGFAEVVDEGESGWLVPPGDADALASVLREKLASPDELARVGAGAAARAETFAVDTIVARLEALYARVAAGTGEGGFDRGIYVEGYRRYFRADDRRDPFHGLYERKRRDVLAHFGRRPRMRILDAGGGYGRLSGPLAARHDVVLADVSPEMLAEARRRHPGLELVEADARHLPFDDGSFDAALALDLFPHLPDLDEGLAELSRVVRDGGELVFDTTNAAPWWVLAYPGYVNWRPKRLVRTLLGAGILPEWRALVRHHRPREVRAALRSADLTLVEARAFGPPWTPKWHLWLVRKG